MRWGKRVSERSAAETSGAHDDATTLAFLVLLAASQDGTGDLAIPLTGIFLNLPDGGVALQEARGNKMWLVYLRFDGEGQTKIGHVSASNKKEAVDVVERAKKIGASFPGSRLTQCAFFYAHAMIHRKPSPEIIFDENNGTAT